MNKLTNYEYFTIFKNLISMLKHRRLDINSAVLMSYEGQSNRIRETSVSDTFTLIDNSTDVEDFAKKIFESPNSGATSGNFLIGSHCFRFYGENKVQLLQFVTLSDDGKQVKKESCSLLIQYLNTQESTNVTNTFVCHFYPLSTQLFKSLNEITRVKMQIIESDFFLTNPLEHIDIPPHELACSAEEVEQLKKLSQQELRDNSENPGLYAKRFNRILTTDPVVVYNDWLEGSVIRIYRDDSYTHTISPENISYRTVVSE
jgi:DNA-directed RNA polymerase subunit H (RpoH/RPB5)